MISSVSTVGSVEGNLRVRVAAPTRKRRRTVQRLLAIQRVSPCVITGVSGSDTCPVLSVSGLYEIHDGEIDILEGMQEKNATHDGEEATYGTDDVAVCKLLPLVEQNSRGHYGECGEHDIVQRSHERRVEKIQGLVQVVHLDRDAHGHGEGKEPGEGVLQLTVATQSQFEGYAEPLAGHDGEGANEGADGNVDQDVGLAVLWTHPVDQIYCHHHCKYRVQQETCATECE